MEQCQCECCGRVETLTRAVIEGWYGGFWMCDEWEQGAVCVDCGDGPMFTTETRPFGALEVVG